MNIQSAFQDVKAFHQAFGHPAPEAVTALSYGRAKARANWTHEEATELEEACDLAEDEIDVVVRQADAALDGIYFNLGTLVEMGLDPQPIWNIIQQANMSKMHDMDGTMVVVYYPEGHEKAGKIMKPADWQDPAPLIRAEVLRQIGARDNETR